VGVIKLPHISNFTDFEPLVVDDEIELSFITTPTEALSCDMLILPGSKRVVDDLAWLRERGFEKVLCDKKRLVVAICGGYEMLFERLIDTAGIESNVVETEGLGRFKGDVVFQKEKIVQKGCYKLFGIMCQGYEIHNGTTKKRSKKKKNLYGTFVHGIFENDALREHFFKKINPNYQGYNFKEYKKSAIADFATHIERHLDMEKIYKEIQC